MAAVKINPALDGTQLLNSGFTQSGATRYTQTVTEYAQLLFAKAVSYAKADKARNAPIEVTHDHVREAAKRVGDTFGKDRPHKYNTLMQVGEQLAGIGFGVGVTLATQSATQFPGTITLAGSLIVWTLLFVSRQQGHK
ncbi:MAG TPA: hypothetical protein VHV55_03830 [Pirellulales bacterium]|jgi:hypothetical protein|nr:hypothetical protein [Pirellulales bacterium]